MNATLKDSIKKWTRRLAMPVLALALAASFATYECVKPAAARASSAAPSAAPLDTDSVSAMLALDKAMETLAAHVTPAVVNVTVTSSDANGKDSPKKESRTAYGSNSARTIPFSLFFGPRGPRRAAPQIEHGMGSGVVISPDGYIVTNNHVVEGAVDIRVTTSNRRVLKAKLIGTDPLTDLAVLKVDATGMTSAPWGDSKEVRPGQTVLAFGNPYGFQFTVTRGIVSAINRANPDATNRAKPGEFIQTDAAINPGNSGGPLVDARGEVVGINTFLVSPSGTFSGMGFAIPSQIVRPTVETLIRDGKVSHGQSASAFLMSLPKTPSSSATPPCSAQSSPKSNPIRPAQKPDCRSATSSPRSTATKSTTPVNSRFTVSQQQPGSTIHLSVLRDGKNMSVPVTLEELGSHGGDNGNGSGEGQGKMRWDSPSAISRPKCAIKCRPRTMSTARSSSRCSPAHPPTMPDFSRETSSSKSTATKSRAQAK